MSGVRGGASASPAAREFEIAYVDAESGAQPCRRAQALDDEVEALVARIVAKPRVAIALGKALFYRQLEQGRVVARNRHDEVVGVSLHIIWKAA